MRIECFYEKLYVNEGLAWFLQMKDEDGKIVSEHKASEVYWDGPCRTVFLPENAGGKRGYILAHGKIVFVGTTAHIHSS